MVTTTVFKMLPDRSSTTLGEFPHIKLPSRKNLENEIANYLKKTIHQGTKPSGLIVIGEWGEGKTEIYDSYITTHTSQSNDINLVLSGRSFINSLVSNDVKSLIENTTLEAEIFLFTIIFAMRDYSRIKNLPFPELPDIQRIQKPHEFINSWLERLFNNNTDQNLIIFFDEFEDLLQEEEALKRATKGLKSVLNNAIELGENQKYQKNVHFILACSPSAYYRITKSKTEKEKYGDFSSRLIEKRFPQVPEVESLDFLNETLKACWKDEVPVPHPLISVGCLNTIARVSQGNPRKMKDLLSNVLSQSAEDGVFHQITGEKILNSLKNESVSVYGADVDALNKEFWDRLTIIIERKKDDLTLVKNLFKLISALFGELNAYPVEDLRERLNLSSIDEFIKVITSLKYLLIDNFGKEFEIYNYYKSDFESVEDLITNVFLEGMSGKLEKTESYENAIIFGKISIPKTQILAIFSYYTFDENQNVKSNCIIPDLDLLPKLLSDLKTFELNNLKRLLENHIIKEQEFYKISDTIALRLYPSPIPIGLDFIEDKELRLSVSRQIMSKLDELSREYLPEYFAKYFGEIDEYQWIIKDILNVDGIWEATMILNDKSEPFDIRFIFKSGEIDEDDFSQIYHREKPSFLLHASHLSEETVNTIDKFNQKLEIGSIIPIYMNPGDVRRLISFAFCDDKYFSSEDHREKINIEIFTAEKRIFFRDELEIQQYLADWIIQCKDVGKIIPEISFKSSSKNLYLALNYLFTGTTLLENKRQYTIAECFNAVRDDWQDGFTNWGDSGISGADWTVTPISDQLNSLVQANLIELSEDEDPQNKQVSFFLHPVFKRTVNLISNKPNIDLTELQKEFISESKTKNLFEDVFMDLLLSSGLLETNKVKEKIGRKTITTNKYSIVDLEKANNKINSELNSFVTRINNISGSDSIFQWKLTVKKYEYRLLNINSMLTKVKKFMDTVDTSVLKAKTLSSFLDDVSYSKFPQPFFEYTKCRVIKDLLPNLEFWITNLESSTKEHNKILNTLDKTVNWCDQIASEITQEASKFKIKFTSIREIRVLQESISKIANYTLIDENSISNQAKNYYFKSKNKKSGNFETYLF
ncbi:MAG: hypothetical protein HeimC3_48570, partial [Candidatus Heimdallarchaeota archaeon LC_3]